MIVNGEIHLFGYLLLQVLYLLVFKFHNLAALNAYTVVMVAVVGYVFIPRLAVAKLPFNGNAAPGQKLHCPVDRCVAYLGILAPDPLKKLFQIDVGIGLKKYIYDCVSLGCGFETLFVQIFLEEFFFVGQFHKYSI